MARALGARAPALVALLLLAAGAGASAERSAERAEARALPGGRVLVHVEAEAVAADAGDVATHARGLGMPKAAAQLARSPGLVAASLALTRGRWRHDAWGRPPAAEAKPPGAELWATLEAAGADAAWRRLGHHLSGLMCASLNRLAEDAASASEPAFAFPAGARGWADTAAGEGAAAATTTTTRWGALPVEAVCTENLTPWLKLLPCRDRSGVGALLRNRTAVFGTEFHSLQLRVDALPGGGVRVTQSATLVARLAPGVKGGFRLAKDVLGIAELPDACVAASESTLVAGVDGTVPGEAFGLEPAAEGSEGGVYTLQELAGKDLRFRWVAGKAPQAWTTPQPPFVVQRALSGAGNGRGGVIVEFHRAGAPPGVPVRARFFQTVPWFARLYLHTLRVELDGEEVALGDFAKRVVVRPAREHGVPALFELELELDGNVTSARMYVDFDKAFLHVNEFPPDAERGFDIPAAALSFEPGDDANAGFARLYTEALLLVLPTPDFSMPFNAITMVSMAFTLLSSQLILMFTRRPGAEERAQARQEVEKQEAQKKREAEDKEFAGLPPWQRALRRLRQRLLGAAKAKED